MPDLYAELVALGRSLLPSPAEGAVLSRRRDVLLVRVGDMVLKAHPARTDAALLSTRLRIAADRPELLSPLGPVREAAGRPVTIWPYGEAIDPGAEPPWLPWEEGAQLLAQLHAAPLPDDAPPWGGADRPARTIARLEGIGGPAATEVRRAFATLPAWLQGEEEPKPPTRPALIHGDWHLGQLVRTPSWLLIDVDDLGVGDPVWDLARPAALYAAGVLPPSDWGRFLGAYQEAGGGAVPPDGDVWGALDLPARTLTIQIAATCVIYAHDDGRRLDEFETALVDTCRRITGSGASS